MNVQECVPPMRGSVRESVRELWSLAGNTAGKCGRPPRMDDGVMRAGSGRLLTDAHRATAARRQKGYAKPDALRRGAESLPLVQ